MYGSFLLPASCQNSERYGVKTLADVWLLLNRGRKRACSEKGHMYFNYFNNHFQCLFLPAWFLFLTGIHQRPISFRINADILYLIILGHLHCRFGSVRGWTIGRIRISCCWFIFFNRKLSLQAKEEH